MSFEWLMEPMAPATFFAEYYEKAPLLIEGKQPAKWETLLSIDVVDQFLATTTPCRPDVFLVDAARDLDPDDYAFADSSPPGRIDLPRAYQLFDEGATISISQLHERIAPLADVCRALEKTFSAHFQTNIYLSPPNAQGFKTHYDSHDVFVLQVSGSKVWTLYDAQIALPLRGQAFDPDVHTPGAPTCEITLRAGDLFYCPRGLFHSARSTDETSLHITLGLIGKTWADVMLEAVSAACLESPALRANLPVGYANAGFDAAAAEPIFREMLDKIAREAYVAPILERLAEDFVTSRRPALGGGLAQRDVELSLESWIAPRPDLLYLLRETDDEVMVLFGASEIRFPRFVRGAIVAVLEGDEFQVRELPHLDDEGKLVLVRRLLKEGMLVRKKCS